MRHKFKKGQFVDYFGIVFGHYHTTESYRQFLVSGYTGAGLVLVTDEDGEEYELKEDVLEGR